MDGNYKEKGMSCHSDVFRLYLTASLFGLLTAKFHRLGGLNSLRLEAPDGQIRGSGG